MKGNPLESPHALPAECFRQAELETFQSLEGQRLEGVAYYLWRHEGSGEAFLFALELAFGHREPLLLAADEDLTAISILSAEAIQETAKKLHALHGKAVLEKMNANAQPIWAGAPGENLQGIRLNRHESGLYQNDALLLDFGQKNILVRLGERHGLALEIY